MQPLNTIVVTMINYPNILLICLLIFEISRKSSFIFVAHWNVCLYSRRRCSSTSGNSAYDLCLSREHCSDGQGLNSTACCRTSHCWSSVASLDWICDVRCRYGRHRHYCGVLEWSPDVQLVFLHRAGPGVWLGAGPGVWHRCFCSH